jgi:hypothetical protein
MLPGLSQQSGRAYLAGVASGAISIPITAILWQVIEPSTGFATPSVSLSPLGWALVLIASTIPLATWIVLALILAFPPFLLVYRIGHRWTITHWFYYALCGTAAGLPLALACVFVANNVPLAPTAPIMPRLVHAAPFFCLGGGIGGVVYWYMAIRRGVLGGEGG